MPSNFHRIGRSLSADSGSKSITAIAIGLLLVFAWLFWAFRARVTEYEVSDSARLELNASTYPVQASLAGQLVYSRLTLGNQVKAGEVLIALDSSAEELSLAEEQARRSSIEPQLQALRAQMKSEQAGQGDERQVLRFSKEGAMAQYRQADAQAILAEKESNRASRLRSEGILAVAEAERAKAEAQSKRAAAESLKIAAGGLEPELQVRERDREVRLRQIAGDEAKLEAEVETSSAAIRRLEYEIERKRIRAPISGRLGECAVLHRGAHVVEGQQLAIILPNDELHVVAEFNPATAMGRLHPGQHGILRLQAFPWAQFGTVSTHVSRVASEISDGKVRVELTVDRAQHLRIPVQHGLPGLLEVEIERTSPATLILRSAGNMVNGQ
jgi:multidrug resistance efflux pump